MIDYAFDEFPALALVLSGQEKYTLVRTVSDAAEILVSEWPTDDGEEYVIAIKACLDAFHKVAPAADVRAALIRAANAMRISHISVVC
jgi:Ser/Thr protein kinase RdoA (MazF antagonist)